MARGAAVGQTRLFAVAVDAAGEVALSEWRRGAPVALGRCRVEVSGAPTAEPAAPAQPPRSGWTGEVESVGFPFRFDALAPIRDHLFAFEKNISGALGVFHEGCCALFNFQALIGRIAPTLYFCVHVSGEFWRREGFNTQFAPHLWDNV